jgi:2-polyprenyl-6-methoxyphenol hydroxylase-like FAD-dependent oxidoreductase
MAFEDAAILCRKLKGLDLSAREDVCRALLDYENDRLARVKRISQRLGLDLRLGLGLDLRWG